MADGAAAIVVDDRAYTGVELSAALLGEARALARDALGEEVGQAVVSVPLRWDEGRIDALRRAGELAGLEVLAVIDEPSAVALSNRFDSGFGGFVGVFDLGGTSCDFTVINAARADLRVLATAGDASLGCAHVDEVLARAAAEQFLTRHQIDLARVPGAWPRLVAACEQAKRALAAQPTAAIVVPAIARRGQDLDLSLRVDRALLARAARPIVDRALSHCTRALELADLAPTQLAAVYLSGGGSNLAIVREALAAHLGCPVRSSVAPEQAIAIGAAMHAARLELEGRPLLPDVGGRRPG
jgi:molecular chaperone DnaK